MLLLARHQGSMVGGTAVPLELRQRLLSARERNIVAALGLLLLLLLLLLLCVRTGSRTGSASHFWVGLSHTGGYAAPPG